MIAPLQQSCLVLVQRSLSDNTNMAAQLCNCSIAAQQEHRSTPQCMLCALQLGRAAAMQSDSCISA